MNAIQDIENVTIGCKMRRAIWIIASIFLFKPFVTNIFSGWRRMILNLFGAQIVRGANVYPSVKIWAPWNLQMAEGSCLGPDVICYNQARVILQKNAIVSQYSYLCTAGHRTDSLNTADAGLIVADITIGEGAWIGTRAYIGMGVEIGSRAIVGATASVYKDVEQGAVVGGNPAKVIR
ncbi:MAG: putative colanic acid biosynthesis acetyltransferase [Bacteroidales bacterium]|nr:putative colanic acid biosynthesis acetyltransferase [Bacteroidales bacterium]